MIETDCKCGHRELDHDGRCSHRACGCKFYASRDRSRVDECVARLAAIDVSDPERAHDEADKILLACVPLEIRATYLALKACAPWWAAA